WSGCSSSWRATRRRSSSADWRTALPETTAPRDAAPSGTVPAPARATTTVQGAVPAIEFQGVVKRFGDNTVLDGLDFSVAKGDRVTLIGPSGSGKATILRLLMTPEEADGGIIHVAGDPCTHAIRSAPRGEAPDERPRG